MVDAATQHLSFLHSVRLFKGASSETMQTFANRAIPRFADKGSLLCLPDDDADDFFVIRRGWVKLSRSTLDGQEAVLDILSTNGVFGETALFGDGTYGWTAEAVEDVDMLVLPSSLLKEYIESDPLMAINMIKSMAAVRNRQDGEIERFILQNAPQRVGCFLLKLVPMNAVEGSAPCPPIHLPYNKSLLATRLGMTPETFSRALRTLQKNSDIKIQGFTVNIKNLNSLTRYVCQSCSAHFPCENLE